MTFVFDSVASWLSGEKISSPSELPKQMSNHNMIDETVKELNNTEQQDVQPGIVSNIEIIPDEKTETSKDVVGGDGNQILDVDVKVTPLDVDLQEVTEKALNTAKEWGSYFFNVGKAATQQVAKTAKHLKDSVEEKTILGDFTREQERFVIENRERKKLSEAAVPPWVGYNEEELMKTQILALSKDKRNLLRNPPAGVQFYFDYESSFPIALIMLEEDPALKTMRFELVPKQIKEEMFWRNYFYRVSLIKQSTQLTSLTHQSGSAVSNKDITTSGSGNKLENETEDLSVGSPPMDHEFVSDAFQSDQINDEELTEAMNQLGVGDEDLVVLGTKKKKVPTATLR